MIELPVVQRDSRGKIRSKDYDAYMDLFRTLSEKYNTCDINKDGVCINYVDMYDENDPESKRTCCDDHFFYGEPCAHLGKKGCTTTNLACGQRFCDTATNRLPKAALELLDKAQKDVAHIFGRNNVGITGHYFVSGKEIKDRLVQKKQK